MEFNPQNPKKLSDQIRWSSDDSGARSYNCAFCQRGFSNAQALGGHMNIHRRDKAKLRENLLSLESNKNPSTSTSDHDQPHHKPSNLEEKVLFQLDSGEEINYTSNHKQVININDSSAEVLPKIPFFAGNNERITEEKSEIDLELRLGLEPHEAPTLSTREFF